MEKWIRNARFVCLRQVHFRNRRRLPGGPCERGKTGRGLAQGIFGGGMLNLLTGKGRRSRNVGHRKVEFGIAPSQTIHCGVVSAGSLLRGSVWAEPDLLSGSGHPDFRYPAPPFSQSDSLKLAGTAIFVWQRNGIVRFLVGKILHIWQFAETLKPK